MPRTRSIRHGFNPADSAREAARYGIASSRHSAGIDPGGEAVPDATTKERDPEMHRARKGQQRHFGTKRSSAARTATDDRRARRARLCGGQTAAGFDQSARPGCSQERGPRVGGTGLGGYLPVPKPVDGTAVPIAGEWRATSPMHARKGKTIRAGPDFLQARAQGASGVRERRGLFGVALSCRFN